MHAEQKLINSDAKKVEIKVVDDQWLRIGESSQPVRDAWKVQIQKEPRESWLIAAPFFLIGAGYSFCSWWIPYRYEGISFLIWFLLWSIAGVVLAIKDYIAYQQNPKFTVSAQGGNGGGVILEHGTKQEAEVVRGEFETLVGKYIKADANQ